MIEKEAWYNKVSDDRQWQVALREFQENPTPETLTPLAQLAGRMGRANELYLLVNDMFGVLVVGETRTRWYRPTGASDWQRLDSDSYGPLRLQLGALAQMARGYEREGNALFEDWDSWEPVVNQNGEFYNQLTFHVLGDNGERMAHMAQILGDYAPL